MKSGFSLLELIIALFISAIISLALYNSFFVTNLILSRSQSIVELDMGFALVYNQLEKDISGIFVPLQQQEEANQVADKKEESPKQDTQKNEPEKSADKKAPPIKNHFFAHNKDTMLTTLSFISCNPIAHYVDAPNAKASKRLVRIVYRLMPEENNPGSYTLIRQESEELDLQAFELNAPKPIRGYTILKNIRSLTGEFEYSIKKKETETETKTITDSKQQKTTTKKQEKESIEFKSITQWLEPEDKKSEQPRIPEYVALTFHLWNNKKQNGSTSMEMVFWVPTYQAAPKPHEQSALIKKNSGVSVKWEPPKTST